MSQARTGLALRVCLVLASTLLGLLLANLAAQRWLPLPARLFQLDERLLFRPWPHARRIVPLGPAAGGAWITTELDSRGLRGAEPESPKRRARILVLGDSLVMAESSRIEETFCARLAVHLRERGGVEPEVLNAGVSGYGPDQECLRFEELAGPLAPDRVVLVLCAHNDCGDLLRNKLFRLGPGDTLVPSAHRLAPELVQDFARAEVLSARPALLRALDRLRASPAASPAKASAADETFPDDCLRGAQAEYEEFVLRGDEVVRSPFQDFYDADVALAPESASAAYKLRLLARVLERLRDDCARAGVPLAVVVVPSSADLCPGFRQHVDAQRFPAWKPQRLSGALAEVSAKLAIPTLDLCAAFQREGAERLYLSPAEFHWNARGEDLGARETAQLFVARGLWPPSR